MNLSYSVSSIQQSWQQIPGPPGQPAARVRLWVITLEPAVGGPAVGQVVLRVTEDPGLTLDDPVAVHSGVMPVPPVPPGPSQAGRQNR